ncbi:MAG: DUF4363 family protein [Clostridium sp.]|nr:DUF4363 family protein [Clostridium sp.]
MKKLYIAIVFLAVAIGLCVFEQYTVERTYEQATEYIDSALKGLDDKDYEQVQDKCRQLSDYWEEQYPFMTAMIDHGSLDDTSVTINSLNDYAQSKSDELESQLVTVKNQIKSIRDNQKVTFGNVF